jgi:filamentous hemagglutinin family protein
MIQEQDRRSKKRMARLMLGLLAASCLSHSGPVAAQVDPATSATEAYASPNGVPIVDIANPVNGLSHNQYNKYNVDSRGLVLNNGDISQISRASELAGQVAANLKLTSQANVILNEVVGANRSNLAGYTEVVGGAADVIVANPYGVTCSNCGFINAPNVTLTTGVPVMNGTALTGFQIDKGDILITGAGLDGSKQDYMALIARNIGIQGQVNAKDLDVIAGSNDWDYATRTASARAGSGAAPTYAVDSSALGGMYANRIRLIATEAGVGVRMNGEAAADAGDFTINASGKVEINNKISAEQDIAIASSATGVNAVHLANAALSSKGNASITATKGEVHLEGGFLTATKNLSVTSASLKDTATAAAGADNNKRYAGQKMTLKQTGAATITGISYSAEDGFSAEADTMDFIDGTSIRGNTVELTTEGALNLNKTGVKSKKNIKMTAQNGAITTQADATQGIQSESGDIAITAGTGLTNAGKISADSGKITGRISGALDNSGTLHAKTTLDLADKANGNTGTLTNSGTILAEGALGARITSLTNSNVIQGTGANAITVANTLTNASGAKILFSGTGSSGTVSAGTLSNAGDILSASTLDMTIGTTLTNAALAKMIAADGFTVRGLTNASYAVNNSALLQSTNGLLDIKGNGGGSAVSVSALGAAGVFVGDEIDVKASSVSIADGSGFTAQKALTLQTGSLTIAGQNSHIIAAKSGTGTGTVTSAAGFTNNGVIHSGYDLAVSAPSITNSGTAAISALHDLTVNATGGNLSNSGLLYSGNTLTAGSTSTFTNTRTGTINTAQDAALSAVIFINNNAINALRDIVISATTFRNETPDGDTRVWNYASTNFNPGGGHYETINGNQVWVEYGHEFDQDPRGGAQEGDTVGADAGSWAFTQYDDCTNPINDGGDKTCRYTATFTTSQTYATPFNKPTLLAGRDMKIQNFDTGVNYGGVISAVRELNIHGNTGASFTNDSLDRLKLYWVAQWNHYEDCNNITRSSCSDWVNYRSYDKRITDKDPNNPNTTGIVVIGTAGAGISAGSLVFNVGSLVNNNAVQTVSAPGGTSPGGTTADTSGITPTSFGGINIALPTNPNGFFVISKAPGSKYLVETNPLYASSDALGSDYLAKRFGLNPDLIQRRMGDASYEMYLIRQQLIAKLGNNLLVRGESEAQQMQRLMDNGADIGKALGLTYGQALTDEQIASLSGDMVWMVETEVNGEKVLAPVVYLSQATKNAIATGAVITANNVNMQLASLTNTGGTIQGSNALNVTSTGDIRNTSGTITGGNVNIASTEGSITNETYTTYHGDQNNGSTQLGRTGTIGATGDLSLDAAQNITNRGANMNAGGNADLNAGGNITFDTVQDNRAKTTESSSGNMIDGSTTRTHETSTTNVRSGLTVGGNLTTDSKGDTTFAGTDVNVDGDADVNADGNLNILSRDDVNTKSVSTSKNGVGVGGGVYGIETETTDTYQSRNKGSNFNVGGNADLAAGKDLTVQGSTVESGGNMDLTGENVNIVEGRDIDKSKTTKTTQTFGKVDMGEGFTQDEEEEQPEETDRGGVSAKASAEAETGYENNGGVTLSETSITNTTHDKSTAVGSSVKSGGNMNIKADNDVLVRGSDVAADGDVGVDAKNVTVTAAVNTETSTYDNTTAKVGLYGSTSNEAGAGAEAEAYAAAEGKGAPEAGASASAQAGASSENTLDVVRVDETNRTTNDVTHTGGSIKSGGNTKIDAENKLAVHGSSLESGGNMDLEAKDMAFTAATDSHTETENSSHTRAGLYLDADASASAGASASAQGMVGEAEASANAEANAGVGLYGSNTTQGSVSGTTTAQTSSIKSGGNLSRTADNNITDVGTQIEAGGDFTQNSESWDSKAAANTSFSNSSSDSHTAKVGLYAEAGAEAQASASLQGTDHGAGANASVGVSASYSGSTSDKTSNSSEAVVSNIKSGGNVKTTTTGKTSLEGTNLESGGDMELNASSLDYKAARNTESASEGSTNIDASAKVGIDATKAVTGEIKGGYGEESSSSSSSTSVVGGMKSGGNLKVKTTGDANFEGTNIDAGGDAGIDAGGDVNFNAAHNTSQSSETSWNVEAGISASKNKSKNTSGKGIEASGGYQTSEEKSDEAVGGSIKSGGKLDVKSGNNATFEGTDLKSGGDMSVEAGNDVTFNAAESTSSSSGWGVEASISGSTGGQRGQNGKTRNREKEAEGGISGGYNESDERTSDVSNLSSGGNVKIKSGNNVNLEGTNIEAEGAADIDAEKDVNVTAATNTSHSIGFSAGAEGIVTKEGADEDGNGIQYETQKKGKSGFELSGEDSTTKTGGSIKAKTIGITSGNDTNLEGTMTESKGDTTINAGGDVNLTAAESSHVEGGIGMGVGSKGAGVSRASIDTGVDQQGVRMKSGNDVNITSGGKTVMEGTKIEADGNANIDAQGGVVKKFTGEAGFDFGLDHAGGTADIQGVEITEHGEDNSAVGDDSDALKTVFNTINQNGPEAVPPSQEQNDINNEIERLDTDENLTPEQRTQKRETLQKKLENQKAIDMVKQDESLTDAQKTKLLKELNAKQKKLGE